MENGTLIMLKMEAVREEILVMIPMLVPMILCIATSAPLEKIGSIIGRGGENAKQLRTETQAKIRIGESVPGCEERVITIFSSSRETNTINDGEDKVCPAQNALFRVHERLASDEGPGNEDSEEVVPQVTVRLLVPSDQIWMHYWKRPVGISSKESAVRLARKYACLVMIIFQHVPLMVMNSSRLVAHVNSCIT